MKCKNQPIGVSEIAGDLLEYTFGWEGNCSKTKFVDGRAEISKANCYVVIGFLRNCSKFAVRYRPFSLYETEKKVVQNMEKKMVQIDVYYVDISAFDVHCGDVLYCSKTTF